MKDWLADFVEYASFGEASERLMWWVGVSTIAGAMRRKCFIDQGIFQWSPNFYILIVAEPGRQKKSTSMDVGMRLLRQIEGINMGPSMVTWQALIEHIGRLRQDVVLPDGEVFEMSPVTLAISEFGSFFDPNNRDLVDNLTDLWDGKLGKVEKMTKTSGNDVLMNPWINIVAGTTPRWLSQNFSEGLVGGGLASRFIFLHETKPPKNFIAYPKRQMPKGGAMRDKETLLLGGLQKIADLGGECDLTEEAYKWGETWYEELQRQIWSSSGVDSGFIVRKQVHLHKLAMVIAASRGSYPVIELEHMLEAKARLEELDEDMGVVLGFVGQSKVTQAAREIVEAVKKGGGIEKRMLYQKKFFRTMTIGEFNEAVQSAIHAELIYEQDGVAKPILIPRN